MIPRRRLYDRGVVPCNEEFVSLLKQLMPQESTIDTGVTGVRIFRIDQPFPRTPYAYDSEILFLGQGVKRAFLGDEIYTYDCSRYLVLPVPMPISCDGVCEPGSPIVGMTVAVDPIEIGGLVVEIDRMPAGPTTLPRGIYDAPTTDEIQNTAIRLLKAMQSPEDARILGPMFKRELIYRVLQSEKGEVLQSLVHRERRFFQIAKLIQRIHQSCEESFDIEKTALEMGMSDSTLHSSFKAVTGTSPLQYIKSVRLHKARRLIHEEGHTAYMAAHEVGYESPSQFSREYKRLFGITPGGNAVAEAVSTQ